MSGSEAVRSNARLEAFCDGVFAIALTLLIIDVRLAQPERGATDADIWRALLQLTPTLFAFLLSFVIIFITWTNHHALLKAVRGSSSSFIYANALLLLTVVIIPFPTSLLGADIFTDHAAPAVVLYNAVIAVQSIAWILVSRTALTGQLAEGDHAKAAMRANVRNGYFACAFYSLLAVTALWFPLAVAVATTGSWLFWLVIGIRRSTSERH